MALGEMWLLALTLLQMAARVAAFVFLVPVPYLRAAPPQVKAALSVLLAFLLLPGHKGPPMVAAGVGLDRLAMAMAGETLLGMAVSVSAALVLGIAMEVFVLAARLVGLNAGFGYVSTIDPTTQADSGVLDVVGGLLAALVILTSGMDRPLLLLLSRSLAAPHIPDTAGAAQAMGALLGQAWTAGARLALPVIVLLLVIDLLLALGSKFQAQLQMITLSFPLKILGGLWMLSFGMAVWPELLSRVMSDALALLARLLGRW
ncbi:MAG: flagellar biosynthetic protein FliR [Bryobacterales bacterium]|nr:flagellar biosynthetic protein FliR [Bryobacterales bacterium]